MNKKQIELLQTEANTVIANVHRAVKTLTAENPLILFDKDKVEGDEDFIYDLPIGYNVDKYSTYQQGAVCKVQGDDVELYLTGDEAGQTFDIQLNQLPFESLVELLSYLNERAEA
jgi:hypothetical protein